MRARPKKNRDTRFEKVKELFATVSAEGVLDKAASFGNDNQLFLEIGCGKGAFVNALSQREPSACLLALDCMPDIILMAMEKALSFENRNIRFLVYNAQKIEELIPEQSVSRLYLNFSDPWPKKKHAKRRLTSPDFLNKYKKILKKDGRIFFKTDNRPLFDYSLESFRNCGFQLENVCFDLHSSPLNEQNIQTEYEKNFSEKGFLINCLEAFVPQ